MKNTISILCILVGLTCLTSVGHASYYGVRILQFQTSNTKENIRKSVERRRQERERSIPKYNVLNSSRVQKYLNSPRRYTLPETEKENTCLNLRGIQKMKCEYNIKKEIQKRQRWVRGRRATQKEMFTLPGSVQRSYKARVRKRSLERMQLEAELNALPRY